MKRMGLLPVAWLLAAVWTLAATGCRQRPPAEAPQAASATRTGQGGIARVSIQDLQVPIGQYMPALLGGTVEMAAPRGWTWQRPGKDFLVGFCIEGASLNELPRILVAVEDSPLPEATDIDEQSVADLVARVSQTVADKKLREPVEPVVLGEMACVRYVDFARMGNAVVARQFLKTIAGGKLYTIRLDVHAPQFAKYRDAGYAVAASMRFSSQTAGAAELPAESPAAEPQSDTEP